jgi:single-strand DNA-binding protein
VYEPTITVVGNVSDVPTLRTVNGNVSVASFRVANTPRRRDPVTGQWSDLETVWFGVSAWRQLAEHVATSIKKGDRVVLVGSLTSDTYVAQSGEVRSGLKVTASSVGLELSRGTAAYVKAPRLVTNEEPVSFSLETGEVFDELDDVLEPVAVDHELPVAV